MWIPFSKQINSTFESDRRLSLKLAAGALFGFVLGVLLSLQWARDHFNNTPPVVYAAIVGGCIALSVSLVTILSLKDAVRKRIARGQPPNLLLRLLLSRGFVAVLLAFIVTLVLTITFP